MNLADFLLSSIPIFSGILSLIAALLTALVSKKVSNINSSKDVHVKINGHDIQIDNVNEEELIELLEKFKSEKEESNS